MYYWAIKWKKYGEGDLYVNDKQKEYIESEWIKEPAQRASKQFKINGESYSYDSIEGIQRSTKKIESETKLLYSEGAPKAKHVPLTEEEDGETIVITAWYKRYVSSKEYESTYAKMTSYKMIEKDDGGVWIAVRLPVYQDSYVPNGVELCTELESERLWSHQRIVS